MKDLNDITYKIIGCAMEVHTELGNGFQELIYQRSLAIEIGNQGLNYLRELEMPLYYKGNEVGTRRADFIVEEDILVEIKAVLTLENVHLAQGLNYLKAYNLPTGLLINFGGTKLEYKRLYQKK